MITSDGPSLDSDAQLGYALLSAAIAYNPSMSRILNDSGLGEQAPGLSTATLVEEDLRTSWSDGDHERFAHYVRKEKILESALSGDPVIALCGKVWVPGRDPSRFPVCPQCQAIYDGLPVGGGNSDNQ